MFPQFLCKFTTQRKSFRFRRELKEIGGHNFCASRAEFLNEHLPLLHDLIMSLLEKGETEEAAKVLIEHRFTMEHFKENIMALLVSNKQL